MTRPRAALLATLAATALLAGCSSGDATQADVRDTVREELLDGGYRSTTSDPVELDDTEASEAADCVSRQMFESADFSKEERNEVASSGDADPPSEELVARVVDLVESCVDDASTGSGDT